MRRPPIRIRTFLLGTFVVLLLVPALAGVGAWLIERDHQQAEIEQRLNTATAYLMSHRTGLDEPATVQGFARLLGRLDLLAQLVVVTGSPPGKNEIYLSPALSPVIQKQQLARNLKAGRLAEPPAGGLADPSTSLAQDERVLEAGTRKAPGVLTADLYYRRASRTTAALAGLVSGLVVLLAGLAAATWLAGRWMVVPLARLSAQVDRVAGGDLAIAVPTSRIGEVANIAQAVEGMTAALGQSAQQRAEAEEARRFLVTSVAHDLRTPLFALRGHLQAVGSGLGNPALHLERAEARADALERLIGNLFAYTRDDYAQPALRLEAVSVAELLHDVTAGLEHATNLGGNAFELDGDRAISVTVDRDRLKRALANLLDNALRYSPTGSPVHVWWAALDGAGVEITVRDHGPGIDPELLPHIFEPGIRGPAGASETGAGLGLTIAKRLLESHGASVTASNPPVGGAEFRVTIPSAPIPPAPLAS